MKTEEVYSPIKDDKIHSNLIDSPIWQKAFTKEEMTNEYSIWYKYSIKFEGLKPVQVTNIEVI